MCTYFISRCFFYFLINYQELLNTLIFFVDINNWPWDGDGKQLSGLNPLSLCNNRNYRSKTVPIDTGRKLNVHQTFNLRPVSTGVEFFLHSKCEICLVTYSLYFNSLGIQLHTLEPTKAAVSKTSKRFKNFIHNFGSKGHFNFNYFDKLSLHVIVMNFEGTVFYKKFLKHWVIVLRYNSEGSYLRLRNIQTTGA